MNSTLKLIGLGTVIWVAYKAGRRVGYQKGYERARDKYGPNPPKYNY